MLRAACAVLRYWATPHALIGLPQKAPLPVGGRSALLVKMDSKQIYLVQKLA